MEEDRLNKRCCRCRIGTYRQPTLFHNQEKLVECDNCKTELPRYKTVPEKEKKG